ncbi:unnamed protein product [Durusdinium trenchii]|uniref:Uncharacterized protein n=2 Tax=Durusdinium trenchii TaxID=1381693 RepID=A0ABP0RNB6_9DINO
MRFNVEVETCKAGNELSCALLPTYMPADFQIDTNWQIGRRQFQPRAQMLFRFSWQVETLLFSKFSTKKTGFLPTTESAGSSAEARSCRKRPVKNCYACRVTMQNMCEHLQELKDVPAVRQSWKA